MEFEACSSLKRRATDTINSVFATTYAPSTKRNKTNEERLKVYFELLKTYTPLEWSGSAVSPRELASHGWRSVASNRAQCISCSKFISTELPSILSVDGLTYAKCLSNVRKHLSNSHTQTCLYRSVLVDFHEFDSDASHVRATVLERVKTYKREPAFETELCKLDDVVSMLASFPSKSLFAACLNWTQYTRSICGGTQCVMSCDLCNRVVALSSNPTFDPITSHYKWCPSLDKDSEGVLYWKRIVDCIKNRVEHNVDEISAAALGLIAAKRLRMTLSTLVQN